MARQGYTPLQHGLQRLHRGLNAGDLSVLLPVVYCCACFSACRH